MHKSAEQEHQLKLAVRDIVARNPLISTHQLCRDLKERGFQTANGNPLDWYYVSKIVRKLNREKAVAVDTQKVNERLAITKERYRVIIESMWRIIEWRPEYMEQFNLYPPKISERIRAADTIVKLDLAILKAEMDAGIFDRKLGTVDLNMYRAVLLDPEKAALIGGAFANWGVKLIIPTQRPKVIDSKPADGNAQSGQGVPAAS